MDERDIYRAKEAMQSAMKKGPMRLALIVGAILVFFLFLSPWVQIGAGERGIVLNFGAVQESVLGEGLHFRVPMMQKVAIMDVKVQKSLTNAAASSSDLQEVSSEVALNYHIVQDKANIVYQSIGIQFKERIIDPAVQEVVKAVTAKYTAEELITKRPAVSEAMRANLAERLLVHNIAVDAFSIVGFSFSKIFMEAIESKQTAEQLALKAKRDLDRIKIEAEQTITAARAEAESLRLQRANISPDLIELRKIEANLRAIDKWNGILPQVTGAGAVPFIGVGEIQKR
ncbi:MAG: HflC protein [Nitrospirae bacterium CG_4_10_14_3_um_filter_44_29]|nr:prohibitin family protein [Nitrospirota bacterium]OIO29607.1 MAG: HflC protein [Nitrospirae bacterium CG1_02_44_142]PIP69627.1 MAG: HflC protein [Nitrospirae bacterium CG22_combo_CG10-13_8_21_14_all_44_11]PIV40229.1 MAG: HflC protein [Nitrospirae bacterium CG02_land_8_20_14_3_00_44_33]PIW88470.1 MAG: HflC protein [Nitrospirae bacterium CG_4_8_14_3_um_filter_44_28]PIX87355.1 MAG: HflC protein [Nitrospirae bacterium CG_4_10_14_3_um_filter_44_29]PJA81896.1 MAG: HflC protein [Nitrospirae bacte